MNIQIKDSYKITSKKDIIQYLNTLWQPSDPRSVRSYLYEWVAHNTLYDLGLFKSHTKDVDLNEDEPMWRRICYFIIYCFSIRK